MKTLPKSTVSTGSSLLSECHPDMNRARRPGRRGGVGIGAAARRCLAGVLLASMAATGMAAAPNQQAVKVWKDPNCGCCNDWIAHLKKEGFQVEVFDQGNNGARASLGIPQQYGSCHTASIGGYAVEGHVPAAQIKRLLREAPSARGLAVPRMPVGSPGMDGPVYGGRKDAYDVLLIQTDGTSKVYQSYR